MNPPAKDAHKSPLPSPELVLQQESGYRFEGAVPWEAGIPWGLLAVVTLGFARQRPPEWAARYVLGGKHPAAFEQGGAGLLLPHGGILAGLVIYTFIGLHKFLTSVYANSFSPCCSLPGPCVLCREGGVFQAVSTLLIVSVSIYP